MVTSAVGRVVAFDEHRGLGVVTTVSGEELPFHCTAVADGSRRVAVGACVEFSVVPGLLGRREAGRLRTV